MQEETQMKQLSAPLLEVGKTSMTSANNLPEVQSQGQLELTKTPDEDRIVKMLFALFLTQKRYGLHPDDVPAMGKAYAWALKGYDINQIRRAVGELVKKNPDMPTPADIITQISREEAMPPLEGWRAELAKEIGAIPTRAWFKDCEWDGKTLKTPSRFYSDFIGINYPKVLKQVFGEYEII